MANQPKKYKKFVATAATATLVASAIVPVASAKSFSDVAENNEFQPFIDALSDTGVINGYPDGTFKPGAKLTRGQVVKMLGRWVESNGTGIPADWNSKQRFNDVPVNGADQELVKYAALVKDAGVFTGSNGNLMAGNNITRQQMAKVLNGAYEAVNGVSLVDIAENIDDKLIQDLATSQQEFEGYIQALVDLEISTVSVFRPSENVTRAQFAKFLYNTINLETVESASVKAINNTTVEVTFEEEVTDAKVLDFAIEGLTISNAVVKQTDKKTVVLTTSAQTADVTYTVTVDGAAVGTFKGVSAVIPTKVELVSSSVQGKLGQQVSVQAKVTVAEGQSKAGIPVTFSIPGNTNDAVKSTVVGEAITNAEGVATYTYTRYGVTTDTVTTYATGDRSKFAIGYVFWGVDTILAITDVTEGANINNGANKTYKVTYKDPETGKPVANRTFNVGFLENMNVTSDKVANATVNGVKALQLSNGTALDAATITTDSKGEATFTVSGTNVAVTPVVYALNTTDNGEKAKTYKASALQATAAKVTFGAVQADYKIELTREGGEVAATGVKNGREYKVIVKDKDGKVAKNEIVNIAFNEDLDRVISTNTDAQFVVKKAYAGKTTTVKTDDKGEATFVIASDSVNAYATPIAWIDINSSNAKDGSLDEGEPKIVGPISYFQEAYLDGAAVKSYLAPKFGEDDVVTKFKGTESATFRAELVNQSGKVWSSDIKKVTYTIYNTGANEIKVGNQVISPNRSYTVTYDVKGNTDLVVSSVDNKTTSVKVIATGTAINTDGKDYAFTSKEATASFTSTTDVGTEITAEVVAVNKTDIEFKGKDAISLKDAKFYGGNGSELVGVEAFIAELESYNTGVVVTYIEDKDGNKSFKVVRAANGKKVNAATTVDTAVITKDEVAATTTDVATVTVDFALISGKSFTVNGKKFTYNVAAGTGDALVYKTEADLITKINAAGGDVTATADTAGIKLTGKADGTNFDYRIDDLAPVVIEGVKEAPAVKQQITFTFSTAVAVSANAAVVVNGIAGTVASVEGTKVVVTLDAPIAETTPVTTITVGGKTLKSKLTDKDLDFTTPTNVTK